MQKYLIFIEISKLHFFRAKCTFFGCDLHLFKNFRWEPCPFHHSICPFHHFTAKYWTTWTANYQSRMRGFSIVHTHLIHERVEKIKPPQIFKLYLYSNYCRKIILARRFSSSNSTLYRKFRENHSRKSNPKTNQIAIKYYLVMAGSAAQRGAADARLY